MKKILAYIKENYKFFIFLLFLIVVLNIRLPYTVYAPGGAINISKRLSVKSDGDINLTYVTSLEGTIPSILLSFIMPNWDIIPNSETKMDNETMEDAAVRGKIDLNSSISNAIYVAYNEVYEKVDIKNSIYYITYVDEKAKTNLKIGDEITSYDGNKDMSNIINYVESKNENDEITLTVNNDGKEITKNATIIKMNNESKIGVVLTKINEYSNDYIKYKNKASELGSSGGLMLSLAIYNTLTDNSLSNGKKICGTGTIDEDGSVGEIDGVKYKLAGAVRKKCDIFISPSENYEEALKLKEKNNYNISLIEAKTFKQVLEDLN